MTTPAVNTDVTFTTLGKETLTYKAPPTKVQVVDQTADTERVKKVRPKSSSNPIIKGYQRMGPWSHSWGHGKSNLATDKFTRFFAIPGNLYERSWSKGCLYEKPFARPAGLSFPSQENQALVKALSGIRNNDFRLGIFLAEAGQSIHTVGDTLMRISCEISRFRSKHPAHIWRKVKRFSGTSRWKEVPSQWLALQYGWNPLLADVQGALKHIAWLSQNQRPLIKTVGNAPHLEIFRDISIAARYGGAPRIWNTQKWTSRDQVTLFYELRYPVLAELASLGLINPAEIVWEKLPYSFVVDWFLPIGPWLQALTGALGHDFVGGCYSRTIRCTERFSHLTSGTSERWTQKSRFLWEEGTFTRTIYHTSPVPGLYLKNPLSVGHVANAMSLLVSALK